MVLAGPKKKSGHQMGASFALSMSEEDVNDPEQAANYQEIAYMFLTATLFLFQYMKKSRRNKKLLILI